MAGTTIHQLRGVITSDISGFVRGMSQAENVTRKLVTTWKDAAKAVWSSAQRIVAAVSAMTVGVTKTFADFEDAMIEVGAITRTIGTRDFELLKKAALDMGEATRYTATEAAGGLKELSLSGLDAQQAISALRPTLQLAISAGIGIAQAAGISAKLMKAMGIEARELGRVNDTLVSTFQRSNTDLVMLSEGMKHAAPLAHTLGVSLEDVTAILAKLSDAGFQGEMGGTALRNIMSRLAGAMPRMTKQFKDLGIETMDAAGNMRPLLDVLGDVEKQGLSAGKIMELFGQRGGPQLLALLETGISGVRKFSEETKKQAGAASRIEKERVNTVKGQWDELTSYIEGIFIDAGEKISPEIRKLINETEMFFRANKPEILQEMTSASQGLINGLRELLGWLKDNRIAVREWAASFGGIMTAIASFMAKHPQLMAALIAFKVTGVLGINQAVIGLGKALIETVKFFYSMSTAATAASAATVAAESANTAATTASTTATAAETAATTASAAANTAATATVAAHTAANTAAAAACTTLTTGTTWLTATVVESTFAYVTYESALITVVSTQTALTTTVAATNAALIVQGRTILALAVMQARLSGAVGTTTVSQGLLTSSTNTATTALTVQSTAAKATATSLGTVATASKAAATSGAAAATGISTAFAALISPTGIFVLLAAAVAGVSIAIYKLRVDAQNQIKALKESFKELYEKNEARMRMAAAVQLKSIEGVKNPTERTAKFAEEFQAKLNEQLRFEGMVGKDKNSDVRQFQDLANIHRGSKELAADALKSDLWSQFKPKIEKAESVDWNAARELRAKLLEIQKAFTDGVMPMGKFRGAIENLELELEKINRNFDPAVEQLFQGFERAIPAGKHLDEANKFLTELNSVKSNLGNSFNEIFNEVSGLNDQVLREIITQEQHSARLKEISKQHISPVLEERNKAAIDQKISASKLQKEKDSFVDFESVKDLLTTDIEHLNTASVEAVGQSVEGATPEVVKALVDDFTKLQADGVMAVEDGMDQLILSFLKSVDRAKDQAETQRELNQAVYDSYEPGGAGSDVKKYAKAAGTDGNDPLSQLFSENQKMAFEGLLSKKSYQANTKGISNVAGQSTDALGDVEKLKTSLNVAADAAKRSGEKLWTTADQFREKIKALTAQFAMGEIDEEKFTEKMKELREAMGKAATTGERLIAMQEQYDKIMALRAGNFGKAGVNIYQMIMDKVQSIQMGKIDQWVDWYVQNVLHLTDATQSLTDGFNGLQEGVDEFGNKIGNWADHTFGDGGQVQTTWNNFVNSVQGQWTLLNNTINEMAQSLHLTNLTMTRKLEIQRQIDDLVAKRDALLNQPPPAFIGVSNDPFFKDPGITSAARSGAGGAGGGPITIHNNFPEISKFTSSDVSMMVDKMQQELRRRGKRGFEGNY